MFHPLRLAAGALAAGGALATTLPMAEAQPVNGPPATCFQTTQIMNTHMVGERTLLIRTSARTVYKMEFSADCNDFGEPLILHPFANNGQICRAIDLDVRVRGIGAACNPVSLRQLSPDEVAAIPPKDRP